MPVVEASIDIAGRPDELFALSQDVALRLKWDPFPQALELQGGATRPAVGVRVAGRSRYGVGMEVEYVSFNPPTTVAMKMVRGPWYFRGFAGSWRFHPAGEGATRVTFRYRFEMRNRALGWALNRVVAWRVRRDIAGRLRGLKRGAEELGLLQLLGNPPGGGAGAP